MTETQRRSANYGTLVGDWLKRDGINESDIDDLSQEVLLVVIKELPAFEHNGRTGAFRNWLKTITTNRCRRYWSARQRDAAKFHLADQFVEQLEDPLSDLSQQWDREHDQFVAAKILQSILPEFDQQTMTAFRRAAIDGEPAKQIASDLGISPNQVYKYRFRVPLASPVM